MKNDFTRGLFSLNDNDETCIQIETDKLIPFNNHPYKVLDNEEMESLVESIKNVGVLTPVLVREAPGGRFGTYELISGHRRLYAAKKAGLIEVPAIVREMSDDEAVIAMVDANSQREHILPSEKAFAFKMKMDAIRHQGVTCRHDVDKLEGQDATCRHDVDKLIKSAEIVGEEAGMGGRQVQRYIRLTYLIDELLEQVDTKSIPLVLGVELSYLTEELQKKALDLLKEKGQLTSADVSVIRDTTNETKGYTEKAAIDRPGKRSGFTIKAKKLWEYFPETYTPKQVEDVIYQLLEEWKQKNK